MISSRNAPMCNNQNKSEQMQGLHYARYWEHRKFHKPHLHKGHRNEYIPTGAAAHITTRLHRQPIQNHTQWYNGHIKIGNKVSKIFFDVANIDHYNCILGISFLQEHKAVLNFADQEIHISDTTITLSEEIVPDQQRPAHIPHQHY